MVSDPVVRFHLTTNAGWEYDVAVSIPAMPVSASVDISTSPPGKAVLLTVVQPATFSAVGTLQGAMHPS